MVDPGPDVPLHKIVNRSGYAFHLAVSERIRRTFDVHKWTVHGEEIPWRRNGDEGFIDLAIARDSVLAIIECKKVQQGELPLLFLTQAEPHEETGCRLEIYFDEPPQGNSGLFSVSSKLRKAYAQRFMVRECRLSVGSAESAYCVTTKGESAGLYLDKIASDLLRSCEGLLGDWQLSLPDLLTACVPVVVTNAPLYTCTFDPATIDLGSGELPPDTVFQRRSFVRFRKAFRHHAGRKATLGDAVAQGERTVFVVDARELVPFLVGLRSLAFQVTEDDDYFEQLIEDDPRPAPDAPV